MKILKIPKKSENIKNDFSSTTKEKIIEEQNIFNDSNGNWKPISLNGLGLQEKSSTLLEEYMSWVYANVSTIAESVSQIKIQLFKLSKDDQVTEVKEHPILELIHRPNPYMTKMEFVELITAYRLLTGESPIRLKGDKEPTELWPIDPLTLNPIIGKTPDAFELIVGYELSDQKNGKSEIIKLKPEEIVFIKNINPRNKWRGYGVVEAAQGSIDTMHYSEQYNLNFFKNSAVPFTVLYTDQKLTPQIMDRLKNSWDTNYRGVGNAFKTAVLEAGLKVEKLQTSSKDMDFIEQQKFLRDKLMAMFRTTKIALGITEDVNRAAADASEYIFAKQCIKPKMAQFIEALNEFVLPLFDKTGTLFLDFVDPVPRDRTALMNEYSQAFNRWMTPNEIRHEEGLPDLKGGDEIWQSLVLIPMANAIENVNNPINPNDNNPYSPTKPRPTKPNEEEPEINEPVPLDPQQPKMYRVLRSDPKKRKSVRDFSEQISNLKNRNIRFKMLKNELKREIRKILKTKVKTKIVEKYEQKYKDMRTKEDTDQYVKTLLDNSDKFEAKMNDEMKWKFYNPQMEIILEKLGKGTKFISPKAKKIEKQIGDEFMFNQDDQVKVGIEILTPLMEEILITQGYEAMLTVNAEANYSLLDEARKYLNIQPTKVAKTITETVFNRIRSSLADGIKLGETIPELRDRVIKEYQSLELYQAENIARTEVSKATNFATLDAFKQSGVVEGKEWIVVHDDKLCGYCFAMETLYKERSIKKLDESFFELGETIEEIDIATGEKTGKTKILDYETIETPPLHSRCRCLLKSVEKIIEKEQEIKVEKKTTEEDFLKEIDKELIEIKAKKK